MVVLVITLISSTLLPLLFSAVVTHNSIRTKQVHVFITNTKQRAWAVGDEYCVRVSRRESLRCIEKQNNEFYSVIEFYNARYKVLYWSVVVLFSGCLCQLHSWLSEFDYLWWLQLIIVIAILTWIRLQMHSGVCEKVMKQLREKNGWNILKD